MLIILAPGCAGALLDLFAANTLRPASAREMPARAINRPIKTRGLKNADFEVGFFFMGMNGYDVDGVLDPAVEPEASFVTEVPE